MTAFNNGRCLKVSYLRVKAKSVLTKVHRGLNRNSVETVMSESYISIAGVVKTTGKFRVR